MNITLSIGEAVSTAPEPNTKEELYIDLLKRTLTRVLLAKELERHTIMPGRRSLRMIAILMRRLLSPLNLELVRIIRTGPQDYIESGHAAGNRVEDAETMIGTKQLDQMQACIKDVLDQSIPGDLLEAGVWRGGMTIFMRGVLKAYGEDQRTVWAADSFSGLPNPDPGFNSYGWKAGEMAVSVEEVKSNFARYGLLDDRVFFLKGFFKNSLPSAPIEKLSVLRIDADLYESTIEVLNHLYPKLSPGGYVVIDDYQNLLDCQRAVDEYRTANNIDDPIVNIDRRAVYWIKSA